MFCKYCSQPVTEADYFCPSCGKKLKEKPVSLSAGALAWLLALSVFLPPFGIGLTIRYLKAEDERARTIGWVSLILIIVAIIATIWISKSLMDNLNRQINDQLQNYSF